MVTGGGGGKGDREEIEWKDGAELESKSSERWKAEKPEIIEGIQKSGKLEDDKEKMLIEVITQLKGTFKS